MSSSPRKKAKLTRSLNHYARYSNMAFQMLFIIAIGVFGGLKLDEKLNSKPIFTLVCSIAGLAVAFYVVIKDVLQSTPKNHDKKDTD